MAKSIIRYMILGGDVWVYLNNNDIRLATGSEISRIIDDDPDFALHFSSQNAIHAPKMRECNLSLENLEIPN
ncbi:MAG: hypothetical protein ISR44_03840 [Rhodospirillales bacterium]|nr:hypothetical protein [Rhodospirillales bacterium]